MRVTTSNAPRRLLPVQGEAVPSCIDGGDYQVFQASPGGPVQIWGAGVEVTRTNGQVVVSISANIVAECAKLVLLPTDPSPSPVSPNDVLEVVARHFRITVVDLLTSQNRRDVRARQIAMWFVRREVGLSFPQIGTLFRRDHTTALHAVRKVDERLACDGAVNAAISTLRRRLGGLNGGLKAQGSGLKPAGGT